MNEDEYEVLGEEYYARELNNRGFNRKKATTYKEYMACVIANEGEWSRKSLHGWGNNDDKAWKTNRKTQYRVKKEFDIEKEKSVNQERKNTGVSNSMSVTTVVFYLTLSESKKIMVE